STEWRWRSSAIRRASSSATARRDSRRNETPRLSSRRHPAARRLQHPAEGAGADDALYPDAEDHLSAGPADGELAAGGRAADGRDSARIALSHNPFTLEYYAKAAWTDNAPGMIQSLLVESFERTGKIIAVGPESAGLRPDFTLKTDLREFQAIYTGDDPVPT